MAERFVTTFREAQPLTAFNKGQDFVAWAEANGFAVSNPKLASILSVKNTIFTLESTGLVGDASARITAVLDYSTDAGKILYWKVD